MRRLAVLSITLLTIFSTIAGVWGQGETPEACAPIPTPVTNAAELIAAIDAANCDPDHDLITIQTGADIQLTEANNYVNNGLSPNGLPLISTPITIESENAASTTIRRTFPKCERSNFPSPFRIFYIMPEGDLTLRQLTISNGCAVRVSTYDNLYASDGGGIIVAGGSLMLESVIMQRNVAGGEGGAIYVGNSGHVTIRDSLIGGPIRDDGNAALWGDGGALLSKGGQILIESSQISGNSAYERGGGLAIFRQTPTVGTIITIRNSLIGGLNEAGNYAREEGGGIFTTGESSVTNIVNTRIIGNYAASGVLTGQGGGGIKIGNQPNVNVLNSVIAYNRARYGSAIYGEASKPSTVGLNIANSTISNNNTTGSSQTVAGYFAALNLSNVTITQNTGSLPNVFGDLTNLSIKNSIIGGNQGVQCLSNAKSLQNNILEANASCVMPDNIVIAPGTIPDILDKTLAETEGGKTWLHPIFPGSPAVDAISPDSCTYLSEGINPLFGSGEIMTIDQRGELRPYNGLCDIGAFELGDEIILTTTASITPTPTSTFTATNTPKPTTKPTKTNTPLPPSPSRTPSLTFTKTNTLTPSATFTASATYTSTATWTPSATATSTPTRDPSFTDTPALYTNTRIPSTHTPTMTATATSTPAATATSTETATAFPTLTPTSTDTATLTVTPTATTTGTMTFTPTWTASPTLVNDNTPEQPTATATPPPSGELLHDGGFEAFNVGKVTWKVNGLENSRVKCNAPTEIYAGSCAFLLRGGAAVSGKLTQRVNNLNLDAGSNITLSAFIRATKLPKGTARLRLRVYRSNGSYEQFVLQVPNGTYDYLHFQTGRTLQKKANAVRLEIIFNGGGKLYLDNISLNLEPVSGLIPLP